MYPSPRTICFQTLSIKILCLSAVTYIVNWNQYESEYLKREGILESSKAVQGINAYDNLYWLYNAQPTMGREQG